MRIADSILERLNSQADLVAMIRKHTVLKPAGREFKGCCPFHGEKTPSFYVNPQTNLYYCFGCGVRGNPITFLREFERMSFMEAVQLLSDQTGIDLPKDEHTAEKILYKKTTPNVAILPKPTQLSSAATPLIHTPSNDAVANEQGNLYQLLQQVCAYYEMMLQNTPSAKQYFLSRGLSQETIATFNLGYAPAGWQHLEQAFPSDIDGLKILGLIRTSQKGREFDLLRDRVIFPIKDRQGRVVGFAGRTLGDDMPKYINSSESPVFSKQHILYGLSEARQAKAVNYMMVEGYMDVIALHQAGIYGAVAPMGTAANENQIAHLLKYNDTLTLCFDGDEAGQRAAWRALEVAAPVLPDGKQLKFLTLPDNHDPDTYIRLYGKDAMQNAINGALSTSEYIFAILKQTYDLSQPENKAAAMAKLKELTQKFPKGSSFKWWLNSDIYQKLSGKKTKHSDTHAINYNNHLSPTLQLHLCLLYAPDILLGDPLQFIYQDAKIDVAHHLYADRLTKHNLSVPDLPTWQDIGDDSLMDLIQTIQAILTQAKADVLEFDTTDKRACAIDGRAHLIMASLPNTNHQMLLAKVWREFFHQTQHHSLTDIQLLFRELLCQILQDAFKKQRESSQNLLLSEIHKRRLQALTLWDNAHTKSSVATLLEKG